MEKTDDIKKLYPDAEFSTHNTVVLEQLYKLQTMFEEMFTKSFALAHKERDELAELRNLKRQIERDGLDQIKDSPRPPNIRIADLELRNKAMGDLLFKLQSRVDDLEHGLGSFTKISHDLANRVTTLELERGQNKGVYVKDLRIVENAKGESEIITAEAHEKRLDERENMINDIMTKAFNEKERKEFDVKEHNEKAERLRAKRAKFVKDSRAQEW